jgi:hypothetical protein
MRWVVKVLEAESQPGASTFGQGRLQLAAALSARKLFRTAGFRDYSSDKPNKFYVEHDSHHAMLLFQIQHGSALADCIINER